MYRVVIIGVGALGKRHLSSILNSSLDLEVFCYDINPHALDGFEWNDKCGNKSVKMITAFEELPKDIDFALFAMTSNGRREMFDQLVSVAKVKYILFEKVLFQRIEDYGHVMKKINELEIMAWVNCARREWPSYQSLKEELKKSKEIHFAAQGGRWGLGCNGIHMLDLIEFLADEKVSSLDISLLENRIIESKRKGFCEFYGTITGVAGKCKSFTITSMDSDLPFYIEITTDTARYIIDEGQTHIMVSDASSNWEWTGKTFESIYQSQLTGRVLKSIVEDGKCNLTDYEASMETRLKCIVPLLDFFKENGLEGDICPIT